MRERSHQALCFGFSSEPAESETSLGARAVASRPGCGSSPGFVNCVAPPLTAVVLRSVFVDGLGFEHRAKVATALAGAAWPPR
jgi:hypothetical protein